MMSSHDPSGGCVGSRSDGLGYPPTSISILRAVPAASARYTRLEDEGSARTARILLWSRMGVP